MNEVLSVDSIKSLPQRKNRRKRRRKSRQCKDTPDSEEQGAKQAEQTAEQGIEASFGTLVDVDNDGGWRALGDDPRCVGVGGALPSELPDEKYDGENKTYEYLDHTADVQLHSWGKTLRTAFEQSAVAMFGYMTELSTVNIDPSIKSEVEAKGHDMKSLLFNFLDEFLFNFSTEFFICKKIKIIKFDLENWTIFAEGYGEKFDLRKHPQGTEIKAITYSNMQINEPDQNRIANNQSNQCSCDYHVYVIVDI